MKLVQCFGIYGEDVNQALISRGFIIIWDLTGQFLKNDLDAFIEKLRGLIEIIGPIAVRDIAVQLFYRVLEGKEAEADFLRAVFGEVINLSEPK